LKRKNSIALMIMLSKIFSIRRWGKAVTVAGIAAS